MMNSSPVRKSLLAAALAALAWTAHADEPAADAGPDARGTEVAAATGATNADEGNSMTIDLDRMTEIDIETGDQVVNPVDTSQLREVEWIPIFTRLDTWTAIDDDTLIVWSAPSQPYLLELYAPVPQLRSAARIGVTSAGREVRARFDAVQVDGIRYPIANIYRLTPEDAETLKADENFTGVQ